MPPVGGIALVIKVDIQRSCCVIRGRMDSHLCFCSGIVIPTCLLSFSSIFSLAVSNSFRNLDLCGTVYFVSINGVVAQLASA
jgi:hypothetical protein